QHSAGSVDLLLRELPALLVGLEERSEHFVAVQLADLYRLLGLRALRERCESGGEYERPLICFHFSSRSKSANIHQAVASMRTDDPIWGILRDGAQDRCGGIRNARPWP